MIRTHFYHRLMRKYVSLFGSIFNDMTFIRYNSEFTTEIERIKIPITYSPKEKWISRLLQDPDLSKSTQITLPRMAFNKVSMLYDPTRKQTTTAKMPSGSTHNTQYVGVPYDLTFELNIFAKNIDDGNQIIEQIVPFFTPDITLSANLIPSMGYIKDIPVILTDVSEEIEYEGSFDTTRTVMWTLTFTMKAWFWGPVNNSKYIRTVFANTWIDHTIDHGEVRMRIEGHGNMELGDVVYQGNSVYDATAAAYVSQFYLRDANVATLKVVDIQGSFQTNNNIRTTMTNAVYNLVSLDVTTWKSVSIKIEPDPITANADWDYGYTTTITEFN